MFFKRKKIKTGKKTNFKSGRIGRKILQGIISKKYPLVNQIVM